ncbi:restriction endonuclease subunit S [Enterococcus faecium]|uniref:restriction endonuclease subunit S n=1 Tax=Enterococcus faecium TaxID=1352 RepID=UPI0035C91DE7
MSNDAQPEIRFPGFTDDWEQRKLGEVADIIGGGTPNTNNPEYWNGDIDWYAPAEIGKQIYVKNSQKKISQLGLQKSSAKILPIGTVLFTSRAGIGNTAILAKEGTTNQGFQSIVPHENKLDSYFIFSRTHELKRYGEVTGAGSTFAEVSGKQMAKMPILIPYIDEQQKIGIFFKKLDDTITLHQRKLDLLKETKKGFLQKMFPKNGAKVPEVRFPGFTEDWEERKLSELAEVKTGFPFKNDDFIDGGDYLVITNGNIQNNSALVDGNIGNRISAVSDEIKDKYLLNYGDILVTMDGTVGRTAKVFEKNQILAQRVGRLVANTTPEFLYQWLNTGKFFGDMTKVSHGGTIKHISLSEISDFNAFVPVNEDERVKIGSLLLNIDKTITLHQRKLDLLKETKKGFLQKMFV